MRWAVILAMLCVACGGGDEAAPGADVSGADVHGGAGDGGAGDVAGEADAGGASDPALCDSMWERLVTCGHYYTYPEFPATCEGWTVGSEEWETLYGCRLKPCGSLVACVDGLLKP